MLAPNNPSAGVYTSEIDVPDRSETFGVSTGVIVAAINKGPVGRRYRVTEKGKLNKIFGRKDPKTSFAIHCAEDFLEESSSLFVTRVARDARYAGVLVRTVTNFATTIQLTQGMTDPQSVALGPSDIMLVYAENPGKWADDVYIVMYPDANDPEGHQFFFEVYEGQSSVPSERFACTTFYKRNDNGSQLFVEEVVNNMSEIVRVKFNWQHAAFSIDPEPVLINAVLGGPMDELTGIRYGQMFGGHNGVTPTTGDIIQAWDLYADHEIVDVDILLNAGYTDPAIQHKINEIAQRRLDCIAVLDLPADRARTDRAIDYRRNVLNMNSSSAALYTPYLKVRDTTQGRSYFVPPSGKVGAVFARTDNVAASWFAPAGVNRGIITSIEGLGYDYDQGERNALTDNQINYIRNMLGYGNVIWNADTLYAFKSPLNDIGVRRLLGILHRIVRFGQLRSVFQPNDSFLQNQIRQDMINMLEPIRAGRGLDWFDVVCDSRNNPDAYVANGDLVCDVYLDPTRYTKRIHLNAIVPKKGGVRFAETLLDR